MSPPTSSGNPSAERTTSLAGRERSDMPERIKEKILGKNAEASFALAETLNDS